MIWSDWSSSMASRDLLPTSAKSVAAVPLAEAITTTSLASRNLMRLRYPVFTLKTTLETRTGLSPARSITISCGRRELGALDQASSPLMPLIRLAAAKLGPASLVVDAMRPPLAVRATFFGSWARPVVQTTASARTTHTRARIRVTGVTPSSWAFRPEWYTTAESGVKRTGPFTAVRTTAGRIGLSVPSELRALLGHCGRKRAMFFGCQPNAAPATPVRPSLP